MPATPSVSIGLPVYNGIPYVKELIDSLLAQSFGDFEIIISDNSSTDGTGELCRDYAAHDSRVKYFRLDQNIGLIPNFNRVFELSTAPYYKWTAHDDLYEPGYLEACYHPIHNDPGISVSHSQTVLVDDTGTLLSYDPGLHGCHDHRCGRTWLLDRDECAAAGSPSHRFRQVLAQQIMCAPIYGLMPRRLILKTGLHKSFFGSDKLLLAEMALKGRFYIAPQKLFKKRMHSAMTSVMSDDTVQTRINPLKQFKSKQLVKLQSYFEILRAAEISHLEKLKCFSYLAVHSASSAIPETLRYRPELIPSSLGLGFKTRPIQGH